MSKNIKVNISKQNYNSKLNNLLDSYNSLKLILSPNLSEKNIIFMNSLIDVISSQLKIFVSLLNLTDSKKVYEILNINNQDLSRQIANLYETTSSKISNISLIDKEKIDSQTYFYKKEFDLLEPQKESFNIIDSANFDFIENLNEKEYKDIDNQKFKEIKINKNEKIKEKKIKDKDKDKEKEKEKVRLIKKEKEEKEKLEKLKEKERLVQNLKEQEKKREREMREKARKLIKRKKMKEKEYNKTQIKNNLNFTKLKTSSKMKLVKFDKFSPPRIGITPKTLFNKNVKNKEKYKIKEYKNKIRNTTPSEEKRNNYKLFLFEDIDNEKEQENNFKRKEKRSKTILNDTFQIPYILDLEKDGNIVPMNFSVTFTNRHLNKINKSKKEKKNSIPIIFEEENNINNLNKNIRRSNKCIYNYINKTETNKNNIKKHSNLNSKIDCFSLDEYLKPYNGIKNTKEKFFLTKRGKDLINKKQKFILEDYSNNYSNNYLFDEESINKKTERTYRQNNRGYIGSPLNNEYKKNLKLNKGKNNKKLLSKNSKINYDLDDKNEFIKISPSSFQIPIDDFYLRKKKASLFDRSIFRICHRVIDNYKELEDKEDIFTFKNKSKSKTKIRAKSYNSVMDSNFYFNNKKFI